MSLLVANVRDRRDAYLEPEQDHIYYELMEQLHQEKDDNGEPTYPWRFEYVPDFFSQSSSVTDDMKFNHTSENFGAMKPWKQIIEEINDLNTNTDNELYQVLFLARHGQGYHNVASTKYPRQDWLTKWRFLGTDGEIVWGPDPELTPLGVDQAKENNTAWKRQLELGAPLPSKFYVSPLRRSAHTLVYTWNDIDIPTPTVLENLREVMGLHIAHKRSSKTEIRGLFPEFAFEEGFTENDELHDTFVDRREELSEQFVRTNKVLQRIFEQDWKDSSSHPNKYFKSVTSHAGTIRAFITVTNHRKFTIPTCGMIPIVIKGTRVA
ncbi:uncharacterized protein PRCAT00004192001 [Priceomyces carsonii]|uniref:uncharacterized protein n=1 Tax=Priceomyces carsonii TaxID=28549 RepID=UPI002EDA96AA|nr:unnamed protein product [Priceomyces carsonii]